MTIFASAFTQKMEYETAAHSQSHPQQKQRQQAAATRTTTATDPTVLGQQLILAADEGHLEQVQRLIEQNGVPADFVDQSGWTALFYASWDGHLEIIRYLVETAGASVHFVSASDGWTPVLCAVRKGHLHVLEYLVTERGADVRHVKDTSIGMTPLMRASQSGQTEVVTWLLQQQRGDEPIVAAAAAADNNSIIIHARDKFHFTSLHYAAKNNFLDTVVVLLENGADWTAKDKRGRMPVDVAKTPEIRAVLEEWASRHGAGVKSEEEQVKEPKSLQEGDAEVQDELVQEEDDDAITSEIGDEQQTEEAKEGTTEEAKGAEQQHEEKEGVNEAEMMQRDEEEAETLEAESAPKEEPVISKTTPPKEEPVSQPPPKTESVVATETHVPPQLTRRDESAEKASLKVVVGNGEMGLQELKTPVTAAVFFLILLWYSWRKGAKTKIKIV